MLCAVAKQVLWLLLGVTIKVTLILSAAALGTAALRRAPAALRHFLWVLATAATLALLPLSLALPRWPLPLGGLLPTNHRAAAEAAIAPERPSGAAPLPGAAVSAALEGGPALLRSASARPALGVLWPLALVGLWAGGVAVLLLRFVRGRHAAGRLRREAQPVADAGLAALFQRLAGEVAPGRRVALRRAAVAVPMTVGALRPLVLLPLADAGAEDVLAAVLRHELAHVQRRDCLTQGLAELACAVYWFHPLSWYAARRLRLLREVAADAVVLRGGVRASAYATHLLRMAASLTAVRPRRAAPAALALVEGGPSALAQRVRLVLAPAAAGLGTRPLSRPLAVSAALLLGGALLPLCMATLPAQAATPAPRAAPGQASQGTPLERLVEATLRDRGMLPPGGQVELSLDARVQALAEEELRSLEQSWRPAAASIVVLDAQTGEIRALASRAADPAMLPALQAAYATGSTMKAMTVAAALEQGTIRADQRFFCENGGGWPLGGQRISDAGSYGDLSVGEILAVSSNVGAAKIYQTLGRESLGRWLTRFHFGQRPAVQVPQAAAGSPVDAAAWPEARAALVAVGEGLEASPLQVAAAYAALANEGFYNEPTLVRAVRGADGAARWRHQPSHEPVVSAATARAVLSLLEEVVNGAQGTGRRAAIAGLRVAGKTGTATEKEGVKDSYYASFVGVLPVADARLVILIGVHEPRAAAAAAESPTGGVVAAPAFRRLGERILARAR